MTNYPAALDTATELPTITKYDQMDLVGFEHHNVETNQSTAILALEAKVGANNSAVTTSHDYRINQLEGAAGAGTVRLKDGKLYLKNPSGGPTPWHERIPVVNEDSNLTFDINQTGVA